MKNQRVRDTIKALIGSLIDAEKDEQHKWAKIDMDDKVSRMLELLKDDNLEEKNNNLLDISKKEPLAKLIQDFNKQYQSLYADYYDLTGALKEKFHGKQALSKIEDTEKMCKDRKTDVRLDAEKQEILAQNSELNQKLETGEKREAELSRQVEDMKREKEILMKEKETDLRRIEDAEKISADWRSLEKQLVEENAGLQAQISEFKSLLKKREDELSALTKKYKETINELSRAHERLGLWEMEYSTDLEQLSEGLKRHLQVKGGERSSLASLIQKSHDTDCQLGLKGQNYRTAELKDQDQKVLDDRIAALSGIISTNNKAHQSSIEVLSKQLQELSQAAVLTRERIEKLETEASKEQKEKGGLINAVNQLEEKLEGLKLIVEVENDDILARREETRNSLRRLWPGHYDDLKEKGNQ